MSDPVSKMDEVTEQVINDFGSAQYDLSDHEMTSADILNAKETRAALRSRIRQLVEEARMQAGKDLLHVLGARADD